MYKRQTLSGTHAERLQDLAGVSLPVEATCNGMRFRNFMLITHRGISGPSILQISSYWQPGDDLRLDVLPGIDSAQQRADWQRTRRDTELKTVLSEVLPKRFAQRLCEHWIQNKPLRQYTPAELRTIAELLTAWPLTASGNEGYRTAEVTLGGVDTDSISSSTMPVSYTHLDVYKRQTISLTWWVARSAATPCPRVSGCEYSF